MEENKFDISKIQITGGGVSGGSNSGLPIQTIAAGEEQPPAPPKEEGISNPSPPTPENPAPETPPAPATPPAVEEHEWVRALRSRGIEDLDSFLGEYEEYKTKAGSVPQLDDFGNRLIEAYAKGESLQPYLEAAYLDPSKLTDEEVLLRQIKSDYPTAGPEDIDYLVRKKKEGFGFKPEATEEELSDAMKEMRLHASVHRQKLAEELKKFKQTGQLDEEKQRQFYMSKLQPYFQQQAQQAAQAEQAALSGSPAWKELAQSKKLGFAYVNGKGEKQNFSLTIDDPTKLAPYLLNLSNIAKALSKEDGSIDYNRALKIAAYVHDPEGFEKNLMQFGKTMGTDQVLNTVSNTTIEPKEIIPGEENKEKTPQQQVSDFLGAALAAKGKK